MPSSTLVVALFSSVLGLTLGQVPFQASAPFPGVRVIKFPVYESIRPGPAPPTIGTDTLETQANQPPDTVRNSQHSRHHRHQRLPDEQRHDHPHLQAATSAPLIAQIYHSIPKATAATATSTAASTRSEDMTPKGEATSSFYSYTGPEPNFAASASNNHGGYGGHHPGGYSYSGPDGYAYQNPHGKGYARHYSSPDGNSHSSSYSHSHSHSD